MKSEALQKDEDRVRVERVRHLTAEAWALLEEYYAAIGVAQQDGAAAMERMLEDFRSGMWVAFAGGAAAGCVVLKAGVPRAETGECKRLYVRPAFRRRGVAERLMDALEAAADGEGMTWVYLDTKEAFRASVALYERRGYERCERYNENLQATMFFRKRLRAPRGSVNLSR